MFFGKFNTETAAPLTLQLDPARKLIRVPRLAPFVLLCLLAAVDAVWATSRHIRFTGVESYLLIVMILLAVSGLYSSVRKDRRLCEISYYVALWTLMMAIIPAFTYLCATLQFRLYDEDFVLLDRALGLDWLGYYRFITKNRALAEFLMTMYHSMIPQLFFSILYFTHIRKHDRNDELFWIAFICLVMTSVLSGILPAAGALYHYDIGLNYAIHLRDYFALKNGTISTFSIREMEGIITFPSFHAAAAILLIHAYRRTRIFLPVLCLNILMILATPIFGGHYFVDIAGGGIVAFISIFTTKYLRSWLNADLRFFKQA